MSEPATPRSTSPWLFRLVPAATFLLGLLIGGLVTWVGSDAGQPDAEDVAAPPSVEASETPSAEPTGSRPSPCVAAAASVEDAVRLMRDGAAATRDFRPERLIEVLDQLETLDGELRDLAAQCAGATR